MYAWKAALVEEFSIQQFRVHGVVKGRRVGFTTCMIEYAIWKSINESNHQTVIVAHNRASSNNIADRALAFAEICQKLTGINLATTACNDKLLFFNNSSIKVIEPSINRGCSEHADLLYFDEAAFMSNFAQLWCALTPIAAQCGGTTVIASTPNGMNEFYDRIQVLKTSNMCRVRNIPTSSCNAIDTHATQYRSCMSTGMDRAQCECEFI